MLHINTLALKISKYILVYIQEAKQTTSQKTPDNNTLNTPFFPSCWGSEMRIKGW